MNKHSYYLAIFCLIFVCGMTLLDADRIGATPAPGGASVTGVVKFKGAAEKPIRIDMSADPFCAKAHPNGATTEDVVTDASGGLENVAVGRTSACWLTLRIWPTPSRPARIGCRVAASTRM